MDETWKTNEERKNNEKTKIKKSKRKKNGTGQKRKEGKESLWYEANDYISYLMLMSVDYIRLPEKSLFCRGQCLDALLPRHPTFMMKSSSLLTKSHIILPRHTFILVWATDLFSLGFLSHNHELSFCQARGQ